MPVWEYKTISREEDQLLNDEQLNKLGAYGLELVGILPIARQETVVGRTQTRHTIHYFFKRPKAEGGGAAQ
ncbi:MAG TPA: hypothetical protein P5137_05415 [Candidatus Brocadiia bacterium]|nr:hypothetical protein [Candidatus Brocadiia bacterium]